MVKYYGGKNSNCVETPITTMIFFLSVPSINICEKWKKGTKEEKKEGRI